MEYNLYSCCHKCKVKVISSEEKENLTILPFYKKHAICAQENINNVQTIMDNNGYYQEWMNCLEYRGGYPEDESDA